MVLPSGEGDAPASSAVATIEAEPPGDRGERPLIGFILVERGAITGVQLEAALAKQADGPRKRLGEILVDADVVPADEVTAALAAQFGLPIAHPSRARSDSALVARLARAQADELDALPLSVEADGVVVAVGDPTVADLRDVLEMVFPEGVRLALAPVEELQAARDEAYEAAEGLGDIIRAFEARSGTSASPDALTVHVDENAPIVQVVQRIIEKAVHDRASDVHIEPMEDRVRVRNRIDGALTEVLSLPAAMAQALSSRVKIMAGLNIVERRRPQDGQIETAIDGRPLDIRVSTAGTVFGESVVLRILDRARALYGLGDLGMRPEVEERFRQIIQSPYGLVVCAGPTGSGKTTTLYTTLQAVKSDEINVMTVEDPVEYVFPDINQMSINEVAGLTFASGLRAILRQDPDTILVGEIRDVETARIAIQAALTGHFVLSTVHATDAASALHRFVDMGIEPFLLSSALLATVGQRLVRRSCEVCVAPYDPSPDEVAYFVRAGGSTDDLGGLRAGRGCASCSGTGYYGRVGVYEVLRMTDELRTGLLENVHADAIREVAVADGMVPMQRQAIDLVRRGETTIAEVMRTVYVV
ncbi:MAG TPA: ATPase, T2SS/T4P/T4SS family [Iamia sp.]